MLNINCWHQYRLCTVCCNKRYSLCLYLKNFLLVFSGLFHFRLHNPLKYKDNTIYEWINKIMAPFAIGLNILVNFLRDIGCCRLLHKPDCSQSTWESYVQVTAFRSYTSFPFPTQWIHNWSFKFIILSC